VTDHLIARAATAPMTVTPDGAERRVLSHGGGMMLVEFTFPREGMEGPMHSHPHEQLGYVKSGEIDLHMEGRETVRLAEGGSYYVPPNLRHGVRTLKPTVLVDAFTPIRQDFLADLDQ
jgi:quercetin dioxygenase-like cupin family protein